VKCGWGRDEPTHDRNNAPNYGGGGMNNQNYSNNNQYDSVRLINKN
jgi:hypothetical protein